jgi:peptide/nickel transport system ATP-binding protein
MAPRKSDNLLEIRNLSLSFRTPRGQLRALRDVSVDIPRKRIVGIVGESGCGKSTLISTILRLLPGNAEITGGEILFDGEDLLKKSEAGMRKLRGGRISMIFQDPMTSLNPVLSIGRQMVDIQHREKRSRREKHERAAEMLVRVGIPDPATRLDNFPHQFSGGMRQRIAIAMALMAEPDLLIADEPTTALDATLEVQIIGLLERLQADFGCSIVFVTHHLGVVAELCEDVVVMYAGEVAESGTVRDVFHRPAHPYTDLLLRSDPGRIKQRSRQLPTIPGEIPDLVHPPAGCIFRDRCPKAFEDCLRRPPFARAGSYHFAACHLVNARVLS